MLRKTLTKIMAYIIPVMILVFCLVKPIYATGLDTEHGFTLIGEYKDRVSLISEGRDVFNVSNIAPGDMWHSSIKFKNKNIRYNNSMVISLIDITNNIEDAAMFNILDVTATYNGEVVFTGKYNQIFENLSKLDFKHNDKLDFTFSMPIDCKNEYQNRILDSTWIFEVYYGNVDTGVDANVDGYIAIALVSLLMTLILYSYTKKDEKELEKE